MKQEDVLLWLQRVLVFLGGASHSITQERQRITWGRVNHANTVPDDAEQSKEKEVNLFGEGFFERATKRIEKAKELEKVTGSKQNGAPSQKCTYQDKDPNDLCCFFGKGRPCKIQQEEFRAPQAVSPTGKEVPEERDQEDKQLGIMKHLTHTYTHTHTHTNLINHFLFPIPCVSRVSAFPLHSQLASYNFQSMDSAGGQWLQTRTGITSSSKVAPFSLTDRQDKSSGRGDSETAGKRGNKMVHNCPDQFLSCIFLVSRN